MRASARVIKPRRGVKAEGCLVQPEVGSACSLHGGRELHHWPTWIFLKGSSKSVPVGTRKIVNYG